MILTIEKLIYGGDGLARLPVDPQRPSEDSRGKAVFIPFVLGGEKIDASLTENKRGYARARVNEIVESSPHRVTPACPYFSRCGGCHYQHSSYEYQIEIKKEILRENLRRIAGIELSCEIKTHPSPPWNYRNRSRLQVRTAHEFVAGYFKLASHELLQIEQCPISSPLINRAISTLWRLGRAAKVTEGISEIEFFANADDTKLLVELYCAADARRAAIRVSAEDLCAALPEIMGVDAFRKNENGRQEALVSVGATELTYQTRHASFRVSAGSFFQTNRFLTDELVEIVTSGRSGDEALDLYAGVGLFSTALACNFRHVVSVESSQTAAADLSYNLPTNGEGIRSATEQYLKGLSGTSRADAGNEPAKSPGEFETGRAGKGKLPQKYFRTPDLIVVDPPRSGLGAGAAHALANLGAPRVSYVSCDPATLARDLVPLHAAGYRIDELHLVDLFPQTYHLESVVQLVK